MAIEVKHGVNPGAALASAYGGGQGMARQQAAVAAAQSMTQRKMLEDRLTQEREMQRERLAAASEESENARAFQQNMQARGFEQQQTMQQSAFDQQVNMAGIQNDFASQRQQAAFDQQEKVIGIQNENAKTAQQEAWDRMSEREQAKAKERRDARDKDLAALDKAKDEGQINENEYKAGLRQIDRRFPDIAEVRIPTLKEEQRASIDEEFKQSVKAGPDGSAYIRDKDGNWKLSLGPKQTDITRRQDWRAARIKELTAPDEMGKVLSPEELRSKLAFEESLAFGDQQGVDSQQQPNNSMGQQPMEYNQPDAKVGDFGQVKPISPEAAKMDLIPKTIRNIESKDPKVKQESKDYLTRIVGDESVSPELREEARQALMKSITKGFKK